MQRRTTDSVRNKKVELVQHAQKVEVKLLKNIRNGHGIVEHSTKILGH